MLTQAAKNISVHPLRSSKVDVQNSLLCASTPSEHLRVVIRRFVCVFIVTPSSFPDLVASIFNAQFRTRLTRVFARKVPLWAAQNSQSIELRTVLRWTNVLQDPNIGQEKSPQVMHPSAVNTWYAFCRVSMNLRNQTFSSQNGTFPWNFPVAIDHGRSRRRRRRWCFNVEFCLKSYLRIPRQRPSDCKYIFALFEEDLFQFVRPVNMQCTLQIWKHADFALLVRNN